MSQPNQQPTPEHRLGAHDFLNLEEEILKQNRAAQPQGSGAPQAIDDAPQPFRRPYP